MAFEFKIFLARAENELNLSMMIMRISDDKDMQHSVFGMKQDTYYSASISHAYYSIFYATKAYLALKEIKTAAPDEHKKTYDAFARFVDEGIVDVELLRIYRKMLIKADILLHILELEKNKRGRFTYKRIPQANQEPAEESIRNARVFFMNIFKLCNDKG